MEEKTKQCPVCGTTSPFYTNYDRDLVTYRCPVCGQYQLGVFWQERNQFNMNHLVAFLAHNAYDSADDFERRYYTTASREVCEELRKEGRGYPEHIDSEIVEAWYPKSFAEKIDRILLYIFNHAPHVGQVVHFSAEQFYSFLFIDRYELSSGQYVLRSEDNLKQEGIFMLTCLAEQKYIPEYINPRCDNTQPIALMPRAYARIDEIQRNTANSKNVLVAMSFNDTKKLREAIRKGVEDAKYHAIFIDEVQHNDFITPELLKYIRDSKFVVVDLTHKNNGAYFEEGYAMGLGKPVIQLCKEGVQLHFDIAQKNTIMWTSEDDIPEQLRKRIIATID